MALKGKTCGKADLDKGKSDNKWLNQKDGAKGTTRNFR